MSRTTQTLAPRRMLIMGLLAGGAWGAAATGVLTEAPTMVAVQTDSGYTIPMGARGVVYVETPRQASLFNLRGAAGRGVILIRDAENEGCLLIAVRLVAGDFGGDSIQTKTAAPIRLALRSERVVEVLARGDDVVSDMFQVTAEQDDPQADILILSGLTGTEGFVLNPGGSIVADIFGVRSERTPCKAVAGAS
jgi:hypothetical protein